MNTYSLRADIALHGAGIAAMAGIGLALYRALSTRLAPFDEVFAEGREIGYNRGYWEGRREGRPVVVPIHQEQQEQERRSG